ncbi:hypothetical protein [Herbidospora cretacea]|uniref:hypothetical protein n=1 Tax=Herbidospora cretacea TaxID=28444 RepID=UPI000ABAFB38|nr:hypothetical protein [Herbidospora cretacea]
MITDIEPRVGVKEITTYLGLEGWTPSMGGSIAEIWTHEEHSSENILIPKIEAASDFPKRVRLLLRDLSRIEQRDPDEISREISLVHYDVTNLRAQHPQLIDNSIPLTAGYDLFQAARKLVISSAAATIRRQGHFGKSVPHQARDHARHVRLGHTQRGSYILPVISRALPAAAETPAEDNRIHLDINVEESLFDRRVISTMASALKTLEDMAVTADRMPSARTVTEAVAEGVSREMCQALDAVISSEAVAELDVTFDWSRSMRPPGANIRNISFPKESAVIVERIAEQLKSVRQEREHVLYGLITDLHHEAEEGALGGRVGMETILDHRRRVVWFDLDEDTYQLAVRCHGSRKRVIARGILRLGNPPVMTVSYFAPDTTLMDSNVTAE